MQRRGLSHDSIFEALLLHDRFLGQKFCHRRDPRKYVDNLLSKTAFFDKRLLCEVGRSFICGDESYCILCEENKNDTYSYKKSFKWDVLSEKERNDFSSEPHKESVSLGFSRDIISAQIESFLNKIEKSSSSSKVLLIKGLPGIGKTTSILQQLTTFRMLNDNNPIKFSFCVDRNTRIEEVKILLSRLDSLIPVRIIKGKLAKDVKKNVYLCKYHKKLEELRRKNYGSVEREILCRNCKHQNLCDYQKQFVDTKSSRVVVLDHLFSGQVALANNPDVIVIDEELVSRSMNQKVIITDNDIAYIKTALELVSFKSSDLSLFLKSLREVLKFSEVGSGVVLRHDLGEFVGNLQLLCKRILEDDKLTESLKIIEREFDLYRLPNRFLQLLI